MITLNGYFTNGCIIQADEKFTVKGKASPNAKIQAELSGNDEQSVVATADKNGAFSVEFNPVKRGYSTYNLTFYENGDLSAKVENVLFGDVWIGAGQSNLELKLKYLADRENLIKEYSREKFRFTDVPNVKSRYNGYGFFGLTEYDGDVLPPIVWNTPDNETEDLETAGFSFIFVGEMQKKCDYPVGIVNLAVGGTNITHWLPENLFDDTPAMKTCIATCDGKSEAGSLFYEKICPLEGLAFQGVVWYLGESVAWTGYNTCAEYSLLLCRLIDLYRDILKGKLDFVLVDIGIEGYDEFSVSCVNEQNFLTAKKYADAVQCPLFDLSQNWLVPDGKELYHPIHLVEKTSHAKRAATLAFENFIAKRKLRCPEISSVTFDGERAYVGISGCEELLSVDDKALFGFAVASDDEKYVAAKAEITGKNLITVFSPFVKKPKHLTYGFFLYNDLCNAAGRIGNVVLPLLPYREKIENAQGKYYEEFNPAFFGYERCYENSFSNLGGGARYKPAWKASAIFGNENAELSFSDGAVSLKFPYSPESACIAGLCPELLRTNQPHYLDRYDFFSVTVRAKTPLTLIGIHFKTCTGKQFYVVPYIDGVEKRNLVLPANSTTKLDFDLSKGVDLREGSFPLTRKERKEIALMQITFHGHETLNEVTVSDMFFYYGNTAETDASGAKENKDKLFNYGESDDK